MELPGARVGLGLERAAREVLPAWAGGLAVGPGVVGEGGGRQL